MIFRRLKRKAYYMVIGVDTACPFFHLSCIAQSTKYSRVTSGTFPTNIQIMQKYALRLFVIKLPARKMTMVIYLDCTMAE